MSDCFRSTVAKEGVAGLWKGILSPVICVGLWKSAIFYGHSAVVNKDDESLSSEFIGGMAGGTLGLVFLMPMENVKCRVQAQHHCSSLLQEFALAKTILRESGLSGFYRGLLLIAPGSIGSMVN
jgi:hypothetical protein